MPGRPRPLDPKRLCEQAGRKNRGDAAQLCVPAQGEDAVCEKQREGENLKVPGIFQKPLRNLGKRDASRLG